MAKQCALRAEKHNNLFKSLQQKYIDEADWEEIEGEDLIQECKTFNSISNDDDILQMYLKDVGRIKMINFSEEKRLGKIIQEEIQQAVDESVAWTKRETRKKTSLDIW